MKFSWSFLNYQTLYCDGFVELFPLLNPAKFSGALKAEWGHFSCIFIQQLTDIRDLSDSIIFSQRLALWCPTAELPKGPVGQILCFEKEVFVLERNRLLLSPSSGCFFGWGFPDNSCVFGNYAAEKVYRMLKCTGESNENKTRAGHQCIKVLEV